MVDERELIERARRGDAAAERALYDTHVDRVYRLAYRLGGEDALAQDIVQDTFIRAFDRLEHYRGDAAFSTWLHTVTTSVALNTLRKVKRFRQREAPLDDATSAAAPGEADPDLRERLGRAVDDLPEKYRVVFVLHDVEGYKHHEIADMLGVEVGTSKAQLSRARAKLRDALSAFAKEWVS